MKRSYRSNAHHSLFFFFAFAPRFLALLLGILAPLDALRAQSNYATPYTFSTLAGTAGSFELATDGTGSAARFNGPRGMVVDGSGNLYVTDQGSIRKVTPGGVVTTLAGDGMLDSAGQTVNFRPLRGIARDSLGNFYVTENSNHTIRKITPDPITGLVTVTTLAGLAENSGSADGTGSAARFAIPSGIAVDSVNNVFVADAFNHTIRKITPAGVVTTLAGLAGSLGQGAVDGTGSVARFNAPRGIAIDGADNLYVTDGATIRKITSGGVVTTLAGTAYYTDTTDGTGSAARFGSPFEGLAVDASGNVYVADYGYSTIRKISPAGVVTTLAGTSNVEGSTDGMGMIARFKSPDGLAVDASGNVYVADTLNRTIRKGLPPSTPTITTQPASQTVYSGSAVTFTAAASGSPSAAFQWQKAGVDITGATSSSFTVASVSVGDAGSYRVVVTITAGPAISDVATLALYLAPTITTQPASQTIAASYPVSFTASADGNPAPTFQWQKNGVNINGAMNATYTIPSLVAGDAGSYRVIATNLVNTATSSTAVLTVDVPLIFSTLAGTAGAEGSIDGTGGVARFNGPSGVAVDGAGNVYIADSSNNTIRKITLGGVVSTLAGLAGSNGSVDGTGSLARFDSPQGVAADIAGNVYVADTGNHTIRKITIAGVVTTFAGIAGSPGWTDGASSASQFYAPHGVAVDGSGNVYVADTGTGTIRKITPTGVVATLAGSAFSFGSTDGVGNAAEFNWPIGVAVDGLGNVYVADEFNLTIRKITSGGVVTTLAGTVGASGSSDGVGASALFSGPRSIGVDGSGNVYVADYSASTIRKITSAGVVTTIAGTAYASIGGVDGTGSAATFSGPAGLAVGASGVVYVADYFGNTIRRGALVPTAPVIIVQPVSQVVAASYPGTFTAAASGYPAPTYQWQKNGVNIIGAISSSYTITSVAEADVGSYTVTVTNSVGSMTSNVAVLDTFVAAPSNAVISITVE